MTRRNLPVRTRIVVVRVRNNDQMFYQDSSKSVQSQGWRQKKSSSAGRRIVGMSVRKGEGQKGGDNERKDSVEDEEKNTEYEQDSYD